MRMILTLLGTAILASPALAAEGPEMKTTLTGAAEAPDPGDPDGTGTATVSIDAEELQVCYTLEVSGIDTATMAHIHKGAAGTAGPPVVTLDAPADGKSDGCLAADKTVIAAILQNPADYYVNVHNAAFPKGALRGQLGR